MSDDDSSEGSGVMSTRSRGRAQSVHRAVPASMSELREVDRLELTAVIAGGAVVWLAIVGALGGVVGNLVPIGAALVAGVLTGLIGARDHEPLGETLVAVGGGAVLATVLAVPGLLTSSTVSLVVAVRQVVVVAAGAIVAAPFAGVVAIGVAAVRDYAVVGDEPTDVPGGGDTAGGGEDGD